MYEQDTTLSPSIQSKSYLPTSIVDVSDAKNNKLVMLEKLIGNSKESKDLRNAYLKMIMQPEDVDKKKLMSKPYMGKLTRPDKIYQDQAKWHPAHMEKTTMVENVVE